MIINNDSHLSEFNHTKVMNRCIIIACLQYMYIHTYIHTHTYVQYRLTIGKVNFDISWNEIRLNSRSIDRSILFTGHDSTRTKVYLDCVGV